MGKIGIAFFAVLAFWLLLKSIILPLWGQYLKKEITMVLLIILLFALLHLLGTGLLELLKPFGEVFR